MKIRTDFVTNSSSSSFLIARKDELSEKAKEIIVKFVEEHLMGEKILSPDSKEDEIKKAIDEYYYEDREDEIRAALKKGLGVYTGHVDFECPEYDIADIYQKLWEILEESSKDCFEGIDTSLEY